MNRLTYPFTYLKYTCDFQWIEERYKNKCNQNKTYTPTKANMDVVHPIKICFSRDCLLKYINKSKNM